MPQSAKTKYEENAPYTMNRDALQKYLNEFRMDVKSSNTRVAFLDVDNRLGMFRHSDFIIIYNTDGNPIVVTERIYKKNYSFFEWFKIKRSLRSKKRNIYQEYGFDITIDIQGRYIDYTHYKGDEINASG